MCNEITELNLQIRNQIDELLNCMFTRIVTEVIKNNKNYVCSVFQCPSVHSVHLVAL